MEILKYRLSLGCSRFWMQGIGGGFLVFQGIQEIESSIRIRKHLKASMWEDKY
jgi:hypothetical protein